MAKQKDEINPFCINFIIKGFWQLDLSTVKEDTPAGSATAKSYPIDADAHTSIYHDGLMTWFTTLSTSAKDMFMYIVIHLAYDSDVIELREDKYCESLGISRATFFKAKQELSDRLIVPRAARKNTYWVNPAYVFRGNRLKKYPEKVEIAENPLIILKRSVA